MHATDRIVRGGLPMAALFFWTLASCGQDASPLSSAPVGETWEPDGRAMTATTGWSSSSRRRAEADADRGKGPGRIPRA